MATKVLLNDGGDFAVGGDWVGGVAPVTGDTCDLHAMTCNITTLVTGNYTIKTTVLNSVAPSVLVHSGHTTGIFTFLNPAGFQMDVELAGCTMDVDWTIGSGTMGDISVFGDNICTGGFGLMGSCTSAGGANGIIHIPPGETVAYLTTGSNACTVQADASSGGDGLNTLGVLSSLGL